MPIDNLFREVASRCGLAAMIAPGAVRRSLQQQGSDAETAMATDYLSALPILQKRLMIYLKPHEADRRIHEIREFLVASICGRPEVAAEGPSR